MRILLINPDANIKSGLLMSMKGLMPLGLIYMATILKDKHEVKIFDLATQKESVLFELVKSFRPEIIGMSLSMASTFNRGMQIIAKIKEFYNDAFFVAGGPHINFLKRYFAYFFKKKYFDFIAEGESEFIFKNLVESLENKDDISSVQGIFYYKDGVVRYTGKAPPVDLNTLPTPDFCFINIKKYGCLWVEDPHLPLDWSRGCYYDCIYCSCKKFFGAFKVKNQEKMIEDMKRLKNKYHIKTIFLVDDDFFGNVYETKKLLEAIIRENLDLKFITETRIDTLIKHPDLIKLMKDAGVRSIFIGIEDVDGDILNYYGKNYDRNVFNSKNVKNVIADLRKNGIFVITLFMVGSPLETIETLKEKTAFVKEINPNHTIYQIFTPHGGLLEKFFDENKIKIKDFDYWNCEHFVCETNIDQKETRKIVDASLTELFKKNFRENEKTVIGRKHNRDVSIIKT